jgi:hypothetical protein
VNGKQGEIKPVPIKRAAFINIQITRINHGMPLITVADPMELNLRFSNSGQVEAKNFISVFGLTTTPEGYPAGPGLDEQTFSAMMPRLEPVAVTDRLSHFDLDPGSATNKPIQLAFVDKVAAIVNSQKAFIYLVGFAEWQDEEGVKRKEFCYIVEQIGEEFRYRYGERHNQTTVVQGEK